MKSVILLIVAAALVALIAPGAKAQLTASKAFATAPQSVFPLLDANTRLDMIDYYNSNLSTPSANRLDGQSRITALSDKVLTVEMTPSSTYDIIILPGNAPVIGMVTTLATPAPDSHISFYDGDWKQLETNKLFVKPVLADWLTEEGKKNRSDVELMLPFLLIGYSWDPATMLLTLTNNTNRFLAADIYQIIEPYMLGQLVYRWNGRKFEPVK